MTQTIHNVLALISISICAQAQAQMIPQFPDSYLSAQEELCDQDCGSSNDDESISTVYSDEFYEYEGFHPGISRTTQFSFVDNEAVRVSMFVEGGLVKTGFDAIDANSSFDLGLREPSQFRMPGEMSEVESFAAATNEGKVEATPYLVGSSVDLQFESTHLTTATIDEIGVHSPGAYAFEVPYVEAQSRTVRHWMKDSSVSSFEPNATSATDLELDITPTPEPAGAAWLLFLGAILSVCVGIIVRFAGNRGQQLNL